MGSIAPGKHILLDSNVWRYVIDCKQQAYILSLLRNPMVKIQIAPAVLYEALRSSNNTIRTQLVSLMTNARFQRLMPDAYSESMELLAEIRRVNPNWLRQDPDLRFFRRLERDWNQKAGGFWSRAARSPGLEATYVKHLEASTLGKARAETKIAREETIRSKLKSPPRLDTIVEEIKGHLVESWRIDSLQAFSKELSGSSSAYFDWINPFVSTDLLWRRRREWEFFWLHQADKRNLPRQWLRWAFPFCQRFRKPTQGSPVDVQIATYLLEADLFVSADGAFLDILEQCRPYAPCRLPEGIRLSSGPSGVRQLLSDLTSRSSAALAG